MQEDQVQGAKGAGGGVVASSRSGIRMPTPAASPAALGLAAEG